MGEGGLFCGRHLCVLDHFALDLLSGIYFMGCIADVYLGSYLEKKWETVHYLNILLRTSAATASEFEVSSTRRGLENLSL